MADKTESNWTKALSSDAYGVQVGSYHSRKLAFQKAHSDLIGQIQRGNADAAYYLTRILTKLALVNG